MDKLKFSELSLSEEVKKAVKDMGFEEATPIQSLAIPQMLKGKDLFGQAQTGTGKTAAFGIPIMESIDEKSRHTQALVLLPTRELALQVAEELQKLAKYKKHITILPVYGGQPIHRQLQVLSKGAQVVIGTPGRVMDHLERRTLKLDALKIVVLDEADEMLNMGFIEDIQLILKNTPKERQTVLFSATMPRPIMELTKKFQKQPITIKVIHDKMTVPNVEQIYFEVKENFKLDALCRVLDVYDPSLALVFCNTKRQVDELINHLQGRGFLADGIHGDMNQPQRDRVMGKFRSGAIEVLVATDVAARGIDVGNIEAVFNYDVPHDEESYVHRIGRTARAGKSGHAFTFVSGREIYKIRDIQRYTKTNIKLNKVPTEKDVQEIRATQLIEKIEDELGKGGYEQYFKIVEKMAEKDYTSLDVAAVLLKMLSSSQQESQVKAVAAKPSMTNFGDTGAKGHGMARLFINTGKLHNVRPGDIVGAIAGETGLPGSSIGGIDIYDAFSFVEVPIEEADKVISVISKSNIKGRKVVIEPASSRKR